MSKSGKKYLIVGMDEAGRGPLAGPVAIAGVMINVPHTCYRGYMAYLISNRILKGIKDSKKLSAKQRREWKRILQENFTCHSALVGPKIIDRIGIQKAVRLGAARALRKFLLPRPRGSRRPPRPRGSRGSCNHLVLLDGLMSAPRRYNQKTIIKGDEKVPLIAAASIIAKEKRDAKMLRLHKKFPQYCFDRHKGYGTKLHYKMLKRHGLCHIHRRSFFNL